MDHPIYKMTERLILQLKDAVPIVAMVLICSHFEPGPTLQRFLLELVVPMIVVWSLKCDRYGQKKLSLQFLNLSLFRWHITL